MRQSSSKNRRPNLYDQLGTPSSYSVLRAAWYARGHRARVSIIVGAFMVGSGLGAGGMWLAQQHTTQQLDLHAADILPVSPQLVTLPQASDLLPVAPLHRIPMPIPSADWQSVDHKQPSSKQPIVTAQTVTAQAVMLTPKTAVTQPPKTMPAPKREKPAIDVAATAATPPHPNPTRNSRPASLGSAQAKAPQMKSPQKQQHEVKPAAPTAHQVRTISETANPTAKVDLIGVLSNNPEQKKDMLGTLMVALEK